MLLAGTLALDSEVTFHCAHKSYCQGMKNRVIIQYTLPTSCLIYTVQVYNAINYNNAKAHTHKIFKCHRLKVVCNMDNVYFPYCNSHVPLNTMHNV